MESNFFSGLRQITEDCNVLGLPVSELAFSIISAAKKYSDEEIIDVFSRLPNEVAVEIRRQISDYEVTGQYCAVSSAGIADFSGLMRRISQLI
ncbi:hypothetical protein LOY67_12395 [Pseudomonas sp. B21-056]|jgi:hypothetical protein|uniref:hypothetical protein n=1 Tax=Pseudomonas sp. B21-056 TaxID=2895495 RepID=UPI00223139B9|nr:hypothetical protein [Pseudomonas sp. B21-056]UZE26163.1 hypothetical protein LOY67_12395 [Pseudomonas sp. B21-056]